MDLGEWRRSHTSLSPCWMKIQCWCGWVLGDWRGLEQKESSVVQGVRDWVPGQGSGCAPERPTIRSHSSLGNRLYLRLHLSSQGCYRISGHLADSIHFKFMVSNFRWVPKSSPQTCFSALGHLLSILWNNYSVHQFFSLNLQVPLPSHPSHDQVISKVSAVKIEGMRWKHLI